MKYKVAKFGGTSLANALQMRKVADIVLADPDRRIVVVSAPGKAHSKDVKVTDLLIACADRMLATGSADAEFKAVIDRFAIFTGTSTCRAMSWTLLPATWNFVCEATPNTGSGSSIR